MKVIIFCGGKGTRLREETEFKPKPMVTIGSMPIIWHIMQIYSHYGHNQFILCLGYKGSVIKKWFRDYLWQTSDVSFSLRSPEKATFHSNNALPDWHVILAETGENNMTGSRLKQVEHYIGSDEQFMITYGDGIGNVNINELIQFHNSKKRILTLTGVHPPGRFGEILVHDGHVSTFHEKPQTSSGLVNGGFFVANRALFDYLTDDPGLVFENDPLSTLSACSNLACYEHDGFWQPMDTYQEYIFLNNLWNSGSPPWKVW
jgi:glucose-1-phosphate cytidylyltransferase